MNQSASRQHLDTAWDVIVRICSKVLNHADIYGFLSMDMPDPDIHKMHKQLKLIIIPIFENLSELDFSPDDQRIMINLHQYLLHLNSIVQAISDEDERGFNTAVEALRSEAMI